MSKEVKPKKRVLVVDDDDQMRNAIVCEFKDVTEVECVVDSANSLHNAAKLVDVNKYDLIVSDNSMPMPGQGLDLLRHVRWLSELNKDTTFILNTGDSSLETQAKVSEFEGWYRNKNGKTVSVPEMVRVGLGLIQ